MNWAVRRLCVTISLAPQASISMVRSPVMDKRRGGVSSAVAICSRQARTGPSSTRRVDRPNPGSTAYTIDWNDPGFADVAVDITPPGTARGEGERGRAGIVLWQDDRNFLTITMWLDDTYDGASIAIFWHLDGFEEIYDAVWSMVGTRIYYGKTHQLRVVCDGMHVMTLIDDEPVLYRALNDIYPDRGELSLRRVGLAVNWEWGDDTGSRFENFVAKTRRAEPIDPSK